jgi:hypothetical protein
MKVDFLNDVGAPLAVTAVNLTARASSTMIGNTPIADIATYAMAGGGYLATYMGWGGRYDDFVKNVAIAAAPLAFEKLYSAIKGTTQVGRVARRVTRYPAPAAESPFGKTRLV